MAVKITKKSNIKALISNLEKAMPRILTMIGMTVHTEAKENTPVDTGRLKASISYVVENKKPQGWENHPQSQSADHDVDGEGDGSVVIGTNVVYAKSIEYGHSKRAPSGYLKKALDATEPLLNKIVADELKKELKKLGK